MLCLVVTKTPSLAQLLFVISVVVLISLKKRLFTSCFCHESLEAGFFCLYTSPVTYLIYVGPTFKHCH